MSRKFGALLNTLSLRRTTVRSASTSSKELQRILKGVPEISQLVGAAGVDQLLNITPEDGKDTVKIALKQLFTQIMSASEHVIAKVLSQLIPRLRKKYEERVNMLRDGHQLDHKTYNFLITMVCKNGELEKAAQILSDAMRDENVINLETFAVFVEG